MKSQYRHIFFKLSMICCAILILLILNSCLPTLASIDYEESEEEIGSDLHKKLDNKEINA